MRNISSIFRDSSNEFGLICLIVSNVSYMVTPVWVCVREFVCTLLSILSFGFFASSFFFSVSQFNNLERSKLNQNALANERKTYRLLFVPSFIFLVCVRVCHCFIPFLLWFKAAWCTFCIVDSPLVSLVHHDEPWYGVWPILRIHKRNHKKTAKIHVSHPIGTR